MLASAALLRLRPAMPRGPRLDAPGVLHHVMVRGIERCDIFRDARDRRDFVARLAAQAAAQAWEVYAWALLPNHLHLLVRTGRRPLSATMRRLLAGYAGAFNRRHQRHGHLFQNRYRSMRVGDGVLGTWGTYETYCPEGRHAGSDQGAGPCPWSGSGSGAPVCGRRRGPPKAGKGSPAEPDMGHPGVPEDGLCGPIWGEGELVSLRAGRRNEAGEGRRWCLGHDDARQPRQLLGIERNQGRPGLGRHGCIDRVGAP